MSLTAASTAPVMMGGMEECWRAAPTQQPNQLDISNIDIDCTVLSVYWVINKQTDKYLATVTIMLKHIIDLTLC